MGAYISGIEATNKHLDLIINRIQGRTYEGLMEALNHLEVKMDTEAPVVPIDMVTSDPFHMRDTWFKVVVMRGANFFAEAGYTAYYAPYVHEMEDIRGPVNWTRQGAGQKWFQIHFWRELEAMKLIVAANIRTATI